MKIRQTNDNEEKNLEKLMEQKQQLESKLNAIKKKSDDKEQKTKRLNEQKNNLDKENEDIQKFYERLIERRNRDIYNQPQLKDYQQNIEQGEDDDEKEFELKLQDKIEFNLEQYLTELENTIKNDMNEYTKILEGETTNSKEQVEYQKSTTNAICIKNIINMNKRNPASDEKLGILQYIQNIKETKVRELKQGALLFWQVPNCNKEEELDKYEFIDLEYNPLVIPNEDVEVDSVFQKLSEQKLSTLQLRKKKVQDEKKIQENDLRQTQTQIKDGKEGENVENSKKKHVHKDKDSQDLLKNKKSDIIRAFDKFFSNLPLLRPYFAFKDQDILRKTDKDQTKIGLVIDDYSCVAFFLIILLYSLTLSDMNSNENIKLSYYSDITSSSDIAFIKIDSFEQLEKFLVDSKFSYQAFDNYSEINKNYDFLGALRIRQVRTREKPCRIAKSKVKCYYNNYDEFTKQKEPINYGKMEYEIYQNTFQSGTQRIIKGKFDNYDSSGYIFDISQSLEFNDYVVKMKELFKNNVLNDPSIRAIFIQFTFLNKEDGTHIFFELVFENTPFGVFTQNRSTVYKNTSSDFVCNLDPKLYINILFTLFYAYQFIQYGFPYLYSLIGVLNLQIQIFIYLSVTYECNLINYSLGYKPKEDQFIDIGEKTDSYQNMVMFESISCGCCLIRFVFFLEFFNSFRKIMQSINHGLLTLYISIMFLVLLVSSFALILMNQWGQCKIFFIIPYSLYQLFQTKLRNY